MATLGNDPICATPPKVAKASTVASVADVFTYKLSQSSLAFMVSAVILDVFLANCYLAGKLFTIVEPGRGSADADDGDLVHDVADEVVAEQVGVVERNFKLKFDSFRKGRYGDW